MTQSSTRQEPSRRAASRSARISACAVGSCAQLPLVVPGADDLAVADHHRADRHVVVRGGLLGLSQRQPHEVLVAREEELTHACASVGPGGAKLSMSHVVLSVRRPGPMIRRLPVPLLAALPRCRVARRAGAGRPRLRAGQGDRRSAPARPAGVTAQVARAGRARPPPPRSGSSPCAAVSRSPRRSTRCAAGGGVAYAVPDYIAHTAGAYYPDDPGRSGRRGGWASMQWNFLPIIGVNAPAAWSNLIADHRPGGRGVTIAVLDTGVAYRNWRTFHRAPGLLRHPLRRPVRLRRRTTATRSIVTATARSWPASSPRRRTTATGSPAWPTAPRSCRSGSSAPTAPATRRRSRGGFATRWLTARRSST